MIDPMNAAADELPQGGCLDPQSAALEKIWPLLARHREALVEIVASLDTLERMPLVLEAAPVFVAVLQARVHAEAAEQALQEMLAGPQ